MAGQTVQLIILPHRPVNTQAEIDRDLAPGLEILKRQVFHLRRVIN